MHHARDDDGGPPPTVLRDRAALRSRGAAGRRDHLREEEPWRPTVWEVLREGRWWPAPGAAAGGLVVVAGVVVLLVLSSGTGTGVATPTPGVAVPARPAATAGPTSSTGSVAAVSTPAAQEVVVDVRGQVASPGLVHLAPGARVDDAVRAAGGALPGADLRRVNLARPLSDGEQVVVPAPGEDLPVPAPGAPAATGVGGSGGTTGPVDLNTADLADLDALPGVGPVLAQRVLDWRAEHGRFTSTAELAEVPGIGPTILARLEPLVTV